MALIFTADREGDAEGVTLAQLNEVTERATQECIQRGTDPASVMPKTISRVGGKIRKISIEV